MSRQPRYGELHSRSNKEAWRIWTDRFTEPEPCEPMQALLWESAERADPILLRAVQTAIWRLRPRYAEVLLRRHYFGQTLDEVGSELGVTRERVRQMECQAIQIVRNHMPEAIEPRRVKWVTV